MVALLCSITTPVRAQLPDDAATESFVHDVLVGEYAQAHYSEAKRKLLLQLERCRHPGRCSGPAKAQIYVAMGMIAAQIGLSDEAKNHFANALSEDARVKLPSTGGSPTITNLFKEARIRAVVVPPPPMPVPHPDSEA
ncbi:MAG TPA: hypothetical protein VNO21_10770, partial [Polyangiaceae bacterium]|nr:hypothetical protein [Polyangiaceae bacterium]